MKTKQCLKCGHIASFDTEPPLACPSCGAIYSKVEEAMRTGTSVRPSQFPTEPESRLAKTPTTQVPDVDVHEFAQQMRAESLYPAWRKIVGFFTIIGYIVAALILIGALIGAKSSMAALPVGIVAAALVALFTKVSKELSLMLADLSDATVHMAARSKE